MFFGFTLMMHGQEGKTSDCPFSVMSNIPCSQTMMASIIHHISAYYAFFNVPMVTIFSLILLIAVFLIFILSVDYCLLRFVVLPEAYIDFSPTVYSKRKITRWLSLFEHSPSAI